jgi:hypothetical protein
MKLLTYLKNFMMLFYLLIFYVNSLRKELNTTLEKQEVHDGRQMYNHINLNKNSNITVVLSNKTLYDENSVIINKKFCDFKHLKQKFKHKILNDSRKDKMNFSENIYDPDPHLNITKPDSYNSSSIETVIFSEKSGSEHKINESISSDELLSIIADQTENIKNEICSSCLEIMTSLNILIDEIKLAPNAVYSMTVDAVLNESASPAQDIKKEIENEANDHLFVYKPTTGLNLTITITDKDSKNLPIGLAADARTLAASSGKLQVLLRHQPGTKNGTEIPGGTDIDATFNVAIQ